MIVTTIVMAGGSPVVAPASAHAAKPDRALRSHIVTTGDTLSGIARRYGVDTDTVARHNRIRDRHLIALGRTLVIPLPAGTAGLPERLLRAPERLRLRPRFAFWADRNDVPTDLLEALAWQESGWDNTKVSRAGAVGIGQLMPDTVDFVSSVLIGRPLDPRSAEDNIRMSARFLRDLLEQTDGDVSRSVASYYQGLRSVRERGIAVGTERYTESVRALRKQFPPLLAIS